MIGLNSENIINQPIVHWAIDILVFYGHYLVRTILFQNTERRNGFGDRPF